MFPPAAQKLDLQQQRHSTCRKARTATILLGNRAVIDRTKKHLALGGWPDRSCANMSLPLPLSPQINGFAAVAAASRA